MSYEPPENVGQLFPVKTRSSDKAPTHRGVINIGGEVIALVAWTKTSKRGEEYLALKVDDRAGRQEPERAPAAAKPQAQGDIPY
jgi:uncharacterized protein (DUF736 family)